MRVIEREREHYEVQEVPYGKVYGWRPERIVFECDCGETHTWTPPVTTCWCGARYTNISIEEDRWTDDAYHPWLQEYREWRERELAANVQHEYFEFVGVENSD